ncbi:MAG: hypothetical protein LBT00_05280 [Spirochaetaceae bacterium]|jgi:hypothetical protein|nr:hypothetical protein [Spirochaetaceae bacterium]
MKKNFIITAIMPVLACVTLAAFIGACEGAYIDPETGGGGGGGGDGGKSLEGTWHREDNLGYYYTIEFTSTTATITSNNGFYTTTHYSGAKYKFTGSTLTLTLGGANIKGDATLSGDTLTLSGFGAYAMIFDGTWTKDDGGGGGDNPGK